MSEFVIIPGSGQWDMGAPVTPAAPVGHQFDERKQQNSVMIPGYDDAMVVLRISFQLGPPPPPPEPTSDFEHCT